MLSNVAVRDIETLVHPYTNLATHRQTGPLVLESGKGIYVYDAAGKEYIEGMAASRDPDRPRKSLGVTAPPVAAVMRSALSREIQAAGSLHKAVTLAGDRPTCFAKALRAILFCRSQTSSFMP